MNPKHQFRGPSAVEAATAETETKAMAHASGLKSGAFAAQQHQGTIRRKTESIEKEEMLQAKGNVGAISSGVEAGIASSRGGGQQLDSATHGFMSARFGTDFSKVNIHNNSRSHQLAGEINAKAFTVGNDIYFGEGQYQPYSSEGKHLLAHELTHTLQQNSDGLQLSGLLQRKCDTKDALKFYQKTKSGKKIKWTAGLIEELYKVVGTANKSLYTSAKASGKIDANFVALVCKAQEILGFTGDGVDGKIGTNTINAWEKWKNGGKKGIDYTKLLKDKKLEIGIAVGYDSGVNTRVSHGLIMGVINDKKYGFKLSAKTAEKSTYVTKKKFKVQGDNTASEVEIDVIVHLVLPSNKNPKKSFSSFLSKSEIVLYSGHARYGTGPDFDAKKSPAENFVIGVNSALHKANKLKKGYNAKMNSYLKGRKNDLEAMSKAGKFDPKLYQVWFFDACTTLNYLDEIRGGLVTDAKGKKKSKDQLRVMGTTDLTYPGSAGVILRGILEMQTMEEIMKLSSAEETKERKSRKEKTRKSYHFAD